jgi:hypothetical protein
MDRVRTIALCNYYRLCVRLRFVAGTFGGLPLIIIIGGGGTQHKDVAYSQTQPFGAAARVFYYPILAFHDAAGGAKRFIKRLFCFAVPHLIPSNAETKIILPRRARDKDGKR